MSTDIVLHKDLSDIYKINHIIKTRKTISDENHLRLGSSNIEADKNLDLLISLIYLYLPYCNEDEIAYWIKKEWGLELSLRNIQDIKYKYQSKRLFKKYNGIYVLDTSKVTEEDLLTNKIISHEGLFYTNSTDFIEKFIYFSGVKKTGAKKRLSIGSKLDLINLKKADGELASISEILDVKRFNYMYNVSDMNLIELYLKNNNEELSMVKRNQLIVNSQCNYIIKFNKINNTYFV